MATDSSQTDQTESPGAPSTLARLDWCSYEAAKWAIRHWYHRPEMPVGKLVKVGVWEDETFAGVLIFGMGASDALHKPYGLKQTEVCELARVALNPAHRTPVSRILRVALKLLRGHCPDMRLVVTFAEAEHYGGIYQANGWLYTGDTAPDKQYIDRAGRVWHSRETSVSGWKVYFGVMKRVSRQGDCTAVVIPGKRRYIYPLDSGTRQRVASMAKPYPKPATEPALTLASQA